MVFFLKICIEFDSCTFTFKASKHTNVSQMISLSREQLDHIAFLKHEIYNWLQNFALSLKLSTQPNVKDVLCRLLCSLINSSHYKLWSIKHRNEQITNSNGYMRCRPFLIEPHIIFIQHWHWYFQISKLIC